MIWGLIGLASIVLAIIGGGVVLALSACEYDPTDDNSDDTDEENDVW